MDIKIDHRLPPAFTAGNNASTGSAQTAGTKAAPNDKAATVQAGVTASSNQMAKETAEIERDTLEAAVSDLQEHTQSLQRNLNFSIDENTGRTVVEVTDRDSGEVIRQLPTEEALRLAENLDEMRSLLFKAEA